MASDFEQIVEAACKLLGVESIPDPAPHVRAVRSVEVNAPAMSVSVMEYPAFVTVYINHASSEMIQPDGESVASAIERISREWDRASRDFPAFENYLSEAVEHFKKKTDGYQLEYRPDFDMNLPSYHVCINDKKMRPVKLFSLGVDSSAEPYINHNCMRSFLHKRELNRNLYVFSCREVKGMLEIDWRSDDCGYQMRDLGTLLQLEEGRVEVKTRRFRYKPEVVEAEDGPLPDLPEYRELMATVERVYLEFWVK